MAGEVLHVRLDDVADKTDPRRRDSLSTTLANLFQDWNKERRPWLDEKLSLQNYIFATDTRKTDNSTLPWKNKTTLPKITQIRDNLHANYLAALFPNRNWLSWEPATQAAADFKRRKSITSYMRAKVRQSDFFTTVSQLLLDYIDYGNPISDVEWVNEITQDPETGNVYRGYIGPRLRRISPVDCVFNPQASSFKRSPKIVRELLNVGEFYQKALEGDHWDRERLEALMRIRQEANGKSTGSFGGTYYTSEDWDKLSRFQIDGFGSLHDYYRSGYVEVLTFEGSLFNEATGEYLHNYRAVVADRSYTMSFHPIPSWQRGGLMAHAGWRKRQDNLYAMGPLDNLVGLQYRIDHLENLKADVFDLIAFPPLKIRGSVEEFVWGPLAEIHLDADDSDVSMLVPDTTALHADTQIAILEQKMEEFAGTPREALGMRTPGEKTAFEVQRLENAGSRLFQQKAEQFEIELLEPALNGMLETAIVNLEGDDIVAVLNDTDKIYEFLTITRQDLIASGSLRPVGARRFAAKSNLLQNLSQLTGTNIWASIQPHISAKKMARLVEDSLDLEQYDLVSDNIALHEQAETQRLAQVLSDQVTAESMVNVEPDMEEGL